MGFDRHVRAAIDQPGDGWSIEPTALAQALRELVVERAGEQFQQFAVRRRHLGFGEGVVEGLVGAPAVAARQDAQLVEKAARQRRLQEQAGQAQGARGLQLDPLERAGQIVAAVARAELAEAVGVGHGQLALGAKPGHGVAQLLQLGKARSLAVQAHQESRDARVGARPIERQDHVGQARLPADGQGRERIVAGHLVDAAAQVKGQDHALRQAGRRLEQIPGGTRQADRDYQRQRADHRQEPHQDSLQNAHARRRPGCAAGAGLRS